MGCGGVLLAHIIRALWILGRLPKAVGGGIVVGAVVGLIIALVKGNGWHVLYGCAFGLLGGLVFELMIRLVDRMDRRHRRQ
jgi:hypothetical protein